jgi:hypothetical protein
MATIKMGGQCVSPVSANGLPACFLSFQWLGLIKKAGRRDASATFARNRIAFLPLRFILSGVMMRLLLLLPILFLSSCQTCWRGGEPLRATELASLQSVAADLRQAKNIQVYHGLAHPTRDAAIYAEQVRTVPHRRFEGFAFHSKPVSVSPERIKDIVDLYSDPDSHQALAWPKTTCAGFHPDYALVWSNKKGQRVLQICYGCHEWKYFGPGGTLYTDINEPAYFKKITQWLPAKP